MFNLPEDKVRRLITAIHRSPWASLGIAFGLAAAVILMLIYGPGIKISSKIQDLLPASAPSVEASEILDKRLGNADILVVTLMTDDFDRVKAALPAIAEQLEALPDIDRVDYKLDTQLIEKNALLIFPSLTDLEDYYRELTDAIRNAVKKQLQLFDDDDDDDEEPGEGEGESDVQRSFAWGEWEHDDALSEVGRTFRGRAGAWREYFYNREYTTIGLQLFPSKSSSDLEFCAKILEEVGGVLDQTVQEHLGPIGEGQIIKRIDLGGGYRNALEESDQVKDDMWSTALATIVLLALVIVLFYRSVRAFISVFIPLILGIIYTAGFIALTVGYLNLITAFIFAVLLGLAIDFGIHAFGRWREELAAGSSALDAMVATTLSVGGSNMIAGLTTSLSFLSLTLADFRGFSQFGLVACFGVVISVFTVILVFPAVIFAFERIKPLDLKGYRLGRNESGNVTQRRFFVGPRVVVAAIVIAAAGYIAAPMSLTMELDFNKLGSDAATDDAEHKRIQHGTTQATAPAVIFTDSAEDARAIYRQLEERVDQAPGKKHPRITSFQSLFSLVPDHQAEKIDWIKKICRKLGRKVRIFEGDAREGADELLQHCDPQAFTVEELPDWVKAKFSDKDGRLGEFIFVSPRGSIKDGEVALAFHEEMLTLRNLKGEVPIISGKPSIWAEVIIAMRHDGPIITLSSLLTVFLLVFLFERRLGTTLLIMTPLLVGLGITVGIMAIFDIKLNFFNMLTLPTVIGMGVDDGIHFYHRYKQLGRGSARYVFKTTGFSASLTTLTTVIGFGSLLTAKHQGLYSLGSLTIIAMISCLACTLFVLPAIMQWRDDRFARRQAQT